jgi:hypothetical protein
MCSKLSRGTDGTRDITSQRTAMKTTAVDDTQLRDRDRGATLGQDAKVQGVPRQPHTCPFTAWRAAAFRLSGSPVSAASSPVQMYNSHACTQQSASSTRTALVTLRNPLITSTRRGEAWTLKTARSCLSLNAGPSCSLSASAAFH